jgi:hypothetical protein
MAWASELIFIEIGPRGRGRRSTFCQQVSVSVQFTVLNSHSADLWIPAMHDSKETRDFLQKLATSSSTQSHPSQARQRTQPEASTSKPKREEPAKRDFTPEQAAIVKRIRACKRTVTLLGPLLLVQADSGKGVLRNSNDRKDLQRRRDQESVSKAFFISQFLSQCPFFDS